MYDWTIPYGVWALEAVGASEGIQIMWSKKNIRVLDLMPGSFTISIKLLYKDGFNDWLTRIYGPTTPKKNEF